MTTFTRSKIISHLTNQEAAECRQLTFGKKGEMQRLLDHERRFSKPPFSTFLPQGYKKARAVMLRDASTGHLIAWAMIVYNSGEASAHFFVSKEHRRQGLGRILFKHVQRFDTSPYCFPPGRRSRAFFRSVGALIDPGYLGAT
jgi:GNAT superfamily N-acetyltransferase